MKHHGSYPTQHTTKNDKALDASFAPQNGVVDLLKLRNGGSMMASNSKENGRRGTQHAARLNILNTLIGTTAKSYIQPKVVKGAAPRSSEQGRLAIADPTSSTTERQISCPRKNPYSTELTEGTSARRSRYVANMQYAEHSPVSIIL